MNKIREKDRRKYFRLQAYHLAKYRLLPSKESRPVYTLAAIRDIGAGGICLMLREAIPVSSVIELQIRFPTLDTPLFTVARVVWIKQFKKHKVYEIGAQFTEIAESARKLIDERAKFVLEKVSKDKDKASLFGRLFSRRKK